MRSRYYKYKSNRLLDREPFFFSPPNHPDLLVYFFFSWVRKEFHTILIMSLLNNGTPCNLQSPISISLTRVFAIDNNCSTRDGEGNRINAFYFFLNGEKEKREDMLTVGENGGIDCSRYQFWHVF